MPSLQAPPVAVRLRVAPPQLALAGIRSAITPDDVIDSMRRIGNQLPPCLKETGEGGLATSESAKNYLAETRL